MRYKLLGGTNYALIFNCVRLPTYYYRSKDAIFHFQMVNRGLPIIIYCHLLRFTYGFMEECTFE